eukprot:4277995-Amphidinium_carterae.1
MNSSKRAATQQPLHPESQTLTSALHKIVDGVIFRFVSSVLAAKARWYRPSWSLEGAVRVSFPDYYYGCDLNNTMDPNTGGLSCDWPPTDLFKITAPVVQTSMQEAYVVLNRMKIYTEMINGPPSV